LVIVQPEQSVHLMQCSDWLFFSSMSSKFGLRKFDDRKTKFNLMSYNVNIIQAEHESYAHTFYLKNHHINKENTFVVYELTIGISIIYIKNNKTIILHVNIKSTYKLLPFYCLWKYFIFLFNRWKLQFKVKLAMIKQVKWFVNYLPCPREIISWTFNITLMFNYWYINNIH
jgi:hypothetical protein